MNELKELLSDLGWSQLRLAHLCGVSANTVNAWANGRIPTPHIVLVHLRMLIVLKGFVK